MVSRVLKLLCVFFSVLTVILCGCGKTAADKKEICADFQGNFCADYRGMTVDGTIVNTRQGVCAIDITSPETLSGLSLQFKSGETVLSRDGAKATADEAYLPSVSFPSVIREALAEIAAGNYTADKSPNAFLLPLSCGECMLTVDENALLQSMEIGGADCRVRFSGCEKLGG